MAARISRSTLTKWLQSKAFAEALRAAETDAFRGALRQIEAAAGKAAEALVELLRSRNENIRLRASGQLIEFSLKTREMMEVEDRLRALEEARGTR